MVWFGGFSQERQGFWLSKDYLRDSSSWSSSPLVLLRDIHNSLLTNYDWKDTVPPQSDPGTGARVGDSQVDSVNRTVIHISRRLIPSFSNLTVFMRLTSSGERTFPMLSPSRSRIHWHRSSTCVNPLKISNRHLRSRTVLNIFDCVHVSVLSLLLRTRFYWQRWRT